VETAGKIAIAVAVIGAIATIGSAIISKVTTATTDTTGTSTSISCPDIPPVTGGQPAARKGYVWVPAYVDWAAGQFKEISGHWEHPRANGKSAIRIPGYWDTSQQRCVWIPSRRE
jgi:hypothetical protein